MRQIEQCLDLYFGTEKSIMESSILAQNERWRRVLSMQVERMVLRDRKWRTGE